MTAVPTTHTFTAGEVVTDTTLNNNVTAPINFVLAPPICQVFMTTAQSFATSTDTATTFTSETVDTTNMHSTSVNTDRLTAVYPGWYEVAGMNSYTVNGTGNRAAKIGVNGVVQNVVTLTSAVTGATMVVPNGLGLLYFLNVGDYVQSYSWQSSGGALNSGAGTINSTFAAKWKSS